MSAPSAETPAAVEPPSSGSPWLLRLILAYGALTIVGGQTARWIGERWWPAAYLIYLPPLIYAGPLAVLGLALLIRRERRTALAWTVVALL